MSIHHSKNDNSSAPSRCTASSKGRKEKLFPTFVAFFYPCCHTLYILFKLLSLARNLLTGFPANFNAYSFCPLGNIFEPSHTTCRGILIFSPHIFSSVRLRFAPGPQMHCSRFADLVLARHVVDGGCGACLGSPSASASAATRDVMAIFSFGLLRRTGVSRRPRKMKSYSYPLGYGILGLVRWWICQHRIGWMSFNSERTFVYLGRTTRFRWCG
jgi:hypothetical protein